MTPEQKPIITIKEARKLLGREYADLTEQQVEQFIAELDFMADIVIKRIKKELSVPKST